MSFRIFLRTFWIQPDHLPVSDRNRSAGREFAWKNGRRGTDMEYGHNFRDFCEKSRGLFFIFVKLAIFNYTDGYAIVITVSKD